MEVHLESLLSSSFYPTSIDPEEQQDKWISGPDLGESLEEQTQMICCLLLLLSRGHLRSHGDVMTFKNCYILPEITEDGSLLQEASEKEKRSSVMV